MSPVDFQVNRSSPMNNICALPADLTIDERHQEQDGSAPKEQHVRSVVKYHREYKRHRPDSLAGPFGGIEQHRRPNGARFVSGHVRLEREHRWTVDLSC